MLHNMNSLIHVYVLLVCIYVCFNLRESKPVDLSSISKVSQFITSEGGRGSIIYTEPEVWWTFIIMRHCPS